MESENSFKQDFIYFKPRDQYCSSKKEFDEICADFFEGDLTEDYIMYCAQQAMHAFWLNYRSKEKKIEKELFNEKLKELVNQMLKEM